MHPAYILKAKLHLQLKQVNWKKHFLFVLSAKVAHRQMACGCARFSERIETRCCNNGITVPRWCWEGERASCAALSRTWTNILRNHQLNFLGAVKPTTLVEVNVPSSFLINWSKKDQNSQNKDGSIHVCTIKDTFGGREVQKMRVYIKVIFWSLTKSEINWVDQIKWSYPSHDHLKYSQSFSKRSLFFRCSATFLLLHRGHIVPWHWSKRSWQKRRHRRDFCEHPMPPC